MSEADSGHSPSPGSHNQPPQGVTLETEAETQAVTRSVTSGILNELLAQGVDGVPAITTRLEVLAAQADNPLAVTMYDVVTSLSAERVEKAQTPENDQLRASACLAQAVADLATLQTSTAISGADALNRQVLLTAARSSVHATANLLPNHTLDVLTDMLQGAERPLPPLPPGNN